MSAPSLVDGRDGRGGWLQAASATCLHLLIVAVAIVAALYVAARLRLVVLPLMLAVTVATLLQPAVGRAKGRGAPDALAALVVLVGALCLVAALVAVIVPPAVQDFGELDVSLVGGLEVVQRWLYEGPLGVSEQQVGAWLERAEQEFRDNAGRITRGALSGAIVVVELVAGLALTLVLLFFLLKDGDRIWSWLVELAPAARRADVEALGERVWATLGGYLRGVTLVALFDAVFIALALVAIGVPLVLPLAVLTFVGAYVPIVGAVVAGLAAVLVALVALGPFEALLVAAAVIAVQQVESNLLQPVVVGRSVRLHPVAVLLAVTAGGVLAGIVGAIVATPLVAIAAAMLRYARFEREPGAGAPGGVSTLRCGRPAGERAPSP